MARRKNVNILDVLLLFPWWVSVVVSAVVYNVLVFVVPNLAIEDMLIRVFLQGITNNATVVALFLLVPAPVSYFRQRQKRKRLDAQKDSDTIRSLSWREFEELVAEAYRRKGYAVTENARAGADGGVDIRLHKDGALHLVQCKQWRSQKVGVSVVREMFGVLTSEKAASMSIVTSGIFTQEAKNFADHKPIDLVDGAQLQKLISSVQAKSTGFLAQPGFLAEEERQFEANAQQAKLCPRCASELTLRKAKSGPNAGHVFWGCSTFPKCRHTQAVNS